MIRTGWIGVFVIALAGVGAAPRAHAQSSGPAVEVVPTEPAPPAPALAPAAPAAGHWWEEVALHGFVSFAATLNINNPKGGADSATGHNQYRAFDVNANAFSLDVAELSIERAPVGANDVGMRIDIAAGETIPRLAAANGSSAGPFDLQQAYLYYTFANGLRIDAGKFVTPVGIEVIEGYDGYNDEYSHSFLFTFGPYTHTGVKASYATEKVTVAGYVTQGWDVLIDLNRDISYMAQVILTPAKDLSISLLYSGGKELPLPDPPWRHFFDAVLTYKVSPKVGVGANFDFASEGDTTWTGAAGYLTLALTDDLGLGLRGEVFSDPDGAKTGVAKGQTLTEFTGALSYHIGPHHVLRGELRWDHSSKDVFPTNDGVSSSQLTFAANYLGMF
jgi:hypothetical protein